MPRSTSTPQSTLVRNGTSAHTRPRRQGKRRRRQSRSGSARQEKAGERAAKKAKKDAEVKAAEEAASERKLQLFKAILAGGAIQAPPLAGKKRKATAADEEGSYEPVMRMKTVHDGKGYEPSTYAMVRSEVEGAAEPN